MANPIKKLASKVANEPVVHIAGTLTSALTWASTYVLGDFSVSTQHAIVAGAVTLIMYAIAWIARQYVTPTVKLATGKHAAEKAVVAAAKPVVVAGAEKVAKDVVAVVKEDAEKLIKAAEPTTEPTEAEVLSQYLASVTPASTNPADYLEPAAPAAPVA